MISSTFTSNSFVARKSPISFLSDVHEKFIGKTGHRHVRPVASRRPDLRSLRRRPAARDPPAAAPLLRPRGAQSGRRVPRIRSRSRKSFIFPN
jgi:hypothetical protein